MREKLVARMLPKTLMRLRPGSLDFTKARNLLAKNEMSAEFNRDAAAWKTCAASLTRTTRTLQAWKIYDLNKGGNMKRNHLLIGLLAVGVAYAIAHAAAGTIST